MTITQQHQASKAAGHPFIIRPNGVPAPKKKKGGEDMEKALKRRAVEEHQNRKNDDWWGE